MRTVGFVLAATLAMSSLPSSACTDHAPGQEPKRHAASKTTPYVAGEVREVDVEDGTITLAHGRIASLRMQPMRSMVFKAADAGAIARLKPGDRVRFRVQVEGEQATITAIELARTLPQD